MIRVLFFGTPEIARTVLTALLGDPRFIVGTVVTQPDRPSGRGNKLTPSPVKELALAHSIPVLQPERIRKNSRIFLEQLHELGPCHVAVVIAFGQILPKEVLEFPQHGSVNIHASLLPRWRGAAPIQRAIMAGDTETGVCLMQMDEGLDTGPVYATQIVPITAEDSSGSLHDKLAQAGAELLLARLEEIARGRAEAAPQNPVGVTVAPKVTNDEARIDWSRSGGEIRNLIRALAPAPGAFTTVRSSRFKIHRAESVGARAGLGPAAPGVVAFCDGTALEIGCGDGSLLAVHEGQLEGKRRMPIAELLRGFPLEAGEVLGR